MAKLPTVLAEVVVILVLVATSAGIITDITSSEENDLYVFVLAGQSNAAYYNYNVNAANEELPKIGEWSAFYYGTTNSPIYYGSLSTPTYDTTFESYDFRDMVNSSDKYVIGNIEAPFAASFVKSTGKQIYIINTAIGGQSITNMVPGSPGNDYAEDVFTHAMEVIPSEYHVKLGAILFLQGETDTSMPVDTYKTNFESMLESFRSFTGIHDLILSETRPANGVNSSIAQLELCEELPGVYLGSTAAATFQNGTRYMAADGLHYSQYGDNVIGADLANEYVHVLYRSVADNLQLMKVIIPVMVIGVIVAIAGVILRSRVD